MLLQILIDSKTIPTEEYNVSDFNNGEFTDEEMIHPILHIIGKENSNVFEPSEQENFCSLKYNIFQEYSKKLFGKEVDLSRHIDGVTVDNDKVRIYSPRTGFGVQLYNAKNIIKNSDGTYTLFFDIIGFDSDGKFDRREDIVVSSYELVYNKNGDDIVIRSLTRTFGNTSWYK